MIHYLHRYGVRGFLRLIISRLFTIIFYPGARLIRLPFDVRNGRHIEFGKNFTCGSHCRLEVHTTLANDNSKSLIIGEDVQLNDFVHIVAVKKVVIGNNVLIASKVFISDSNHGVYSGPGQSHPDQKPIERTLSAKPIVIGDNVWIGEFVSVLQGVEIGKGAIIGSMSVVTNDIPAYTIAVGSPAKVIKQYNFESLQWEKV